MQLDRPYLPPEGDLVAAGEHRVVDGGALGGAAGDQRRDRHGPPIIRVLRLARIVGDGIAQHALRLHTQAERDHRLRHLEALRRAGERWRLTSGKRLLVQPAQQGLGRQVREIVAAGQMRGGCGVRQRRLRSGERKRAVTIRQNEAVDGNA
jgi:hypothetical protein